MSRKLDALVERCLFSGVEVFSCEYSTTIKASWRVVDKMFDCPNQGIYLSFRHELRQVGGLAPSHLMPKRICLAALRAVGVSEEEIQAATEGDVKISGDTR